MKGIEYSKGHGTENDFIIIPDKNGDISIDPQFISILCDRRKGLGADGLMRVIKSQSIKKEEGEQWYLKGENGEGEWFMDYRNADGSIAEMCGNGIRVYAAYLAYANLVNVKEEKIKIGTRAGIKTVSFCKENPLNGDIKVDMGKVKLLAETGTTVQNDRFEGKQVDVGNPHLVCIVDEPKFSSIDLSKLPIYDSQLFPKGANVEFITPIREGQISMRVYERGVGETRSCGTGTVASATVALNSIGLTEGEVKVKVPGGDVRVILERDTSYLCGPAQLVAHGFISHEWWNLYSKTPLGDS